MQEPVTKQPASQSAQTVAEKDPLMPRGTPRSWTSGIFACCDDVPVCLLGCFCGFCYQCYIANEMGESYCVPLCLPGSLLAMRAQIRGRHNIEGTLMNDCCLGCFCSRCVLCQLGREVKALKSGKAAA